MPSPVHLHEAGKRTTTWSEGDRRARGIPAATISTRITGLSIWNGTSPRPTPSARSIPSVQDVDRAVVDGSGRNTPPVLDLLGRVTALEPSHGGHAGARVCGRAAVRSPKMPAVRSAALSLRRRSTSRQAHGVLCALAPGAMALRGTTRRSRSHLKSSVSDSLPHPTHRSRTACDRRAYDCRGGRAASGLPATAVVAEGPLRAAYERCIRRAGLLVGVDRGFPCATTTSHLSLSGDTGASLRGSRARPRDAVRNAARPIANSDQVAASEESEPQMPQITPITPSE